MHPKNPPEVLSPSEVAYMFGLNERDRRLFLATKAESLKSQGFSCRKFTKKWKLVCILFKKDCRNCIPASLSQRIASAEREEVGIPVISVDTKKKELTGNFKRPGKALSNGTLKAFDHDFTTFGNGTVVPHGIYDAKRNVGYMTMGVSHDTSKFVCDNSKGSGISTSRNSTLMHIRLPSCAMEEAPTPVPTR